MSNFDIASLSVFGFLVLVSIALAIGEDVIRRQQREDRANFRMDVTASSLNVAVLTARLDALEQAAKPEPEMVPHRFCGQHVIYDSPVQVGTPDYHDFYCAKTAGHDGPHKDQRPGFELEWSETYT